MRRMMTDEDGDDDHNRQVAKLGRQRAASKDRLGKEELGKINRWQQCSFKYIITDKCQRKQE